MAPHSSTLAWKIPWTEEPDRLQFMGLQSLTWLSNFTFKSIVAMTFFKVMFFFIVSKVKQHFYRPQERYWFGECALWTKGKKNQCTLSDKFKLKKLIYMFEGRTVQKRKCITVTALTGAAAAAAKSLQWCPTLCDPIDGSPPSSPVPGILQARTLEWV